jgi:hypothetical protein
MKESYTVVVVHRGQPINREYTKLMHNYTHFLGGKPNWKIIQKITGIRKTEHS